MKTFYILTWFIVVVISSLVVSIVLSPTSYEVAGIQVEAGILPSINGRTELSLPPFGTIKANTHKVPLKLEVKIEGVNQTRLAEALNSHNTAHDYFKLVEIDARRTAKRFLLRLVLFAAIGGLLGSLLLTRKWWKLIVAPLIGVFAIGALATGVYLQFNVEAFAQPRLSGSLGAAPWIATAIEKRLNPVDTLREDVRLIARNLRNFVARVEGWQAIIPEKGAVKVLVVSDIHNNPTAFSLISRVSRDFRVDFVIDTGDITDFGTPVEASLLNQLQNFNRSYIYIPGNHDSPAVINTMKELPNVTVLDGGTTNLQGILVYGKEDPSSMDITVESVPDPEMKKFTNKVEQQISSLKSKPLIVAVHDLRMAERVTGKIPIVLAGHTHKPGIEKKGKTIIINAGSTGATGIRVFQGDKPQKLNFTFSLLYIDPEQKKLIAVDSVEVTGLEGNFVLKRNLINNELSDL